MPSMRQPALSARPAKAPTQAQAQRGAVPSGAPAAAEAPGDADTAVLAPGGFHESSYELQHGLQITESAWPDDVTVPGRLGEH